MEDEEGVESFLDAFTVAFEKVPFSFAWNDVAGESFVESSSGATATLSFSLFSFSSVS